MYITTHGNRTSYRLDIRFFDQHFTGLQQWLSMHVCRWSILSLTFSHNNRTSFSVSGLQSNNFEHHESKVSRVTSKLLPPPPWDKFGAAISSRTSQTKIWPGRSAGGIRSVPYPRLFRDKRVIGNTSTPITHSTEKLMKYDHSDI